MLELNLILVALLKPLVLLLIILILNKLRKMKNIVWINYFSWGSFLFMFGEITCAIDVYVLRRMTYINEGLHDSAMMMASVFYIYGLFQYIISTYGCFKPSCPNYKQCNIDVLRCSYFHQQGILTTMIIIAAIIFALFPLFAAVINYQEAIEAGFGSTVIGTYLYNRTVDLSTLQQTVFPLVALISFFSVLIILITTNKLTLLSWKILSVGLGALIFSYFRLLLINLFHPKVDFTVLGEEVLEVTFLLLLGAWIYPKAEKVEKK
jgi:hypothetical protein